MKVVLKVLGGLVALAVVAVLAALWVYRDIPAEKLEAKYAQPPSRFVEIDGVRYHVRQEGQGPDVVLIHASFASLFMWDEWVKHLEPNFRVTRLDLAGAGLTGSADSIKYTSEGTDEAVASIRKLLKKVGVEEFHMVGTSFGGILAFRYAGDYADEIRSLTLINSAGLIHKTVNPNVSQTRPVQAGILARITPRFFVDDFIRRLIRVEEKATPEVLQTYYDMLMREGNRQGILRGFYEYGSYDPKPWLSKVTAPTLIIWSDGSVLPMDEAEEFRAMLSRVPSKIMTIPGGGHALPISHAKETVTAASEFFIDVEAGKIAGE